MATPLRYHIAIKIMSEHNPHAAEGRVFFVRSTFPEFGVSEILDNPQSIEVERQVSFEILANANWPYYLVPRTDIVYDLRGGRTLAQATEYRVIDAHPIDGIQKRVMITCQRDGRVLEKT